jgi:uncharacterized SAM-binding protein YcdF (DUF218 family)
MAFARRHPVLTATLLVVLGIAGTIGVTGFAVWRAAHTDDASRVDHADVIIVLGAAQYGGRPSPVFQGRLDHAALLYRKGFAGQIMVLGAGQPGEATTEAEAGAGYLEGEGVPAEDVISSPRGSTTRESLDAAASLMDDFGLSSAFLVSDPWHNLRIRKMASDLGIEGYVSATWHSAARSQGTRLSGYVRETFAYLVYRLTGK